MIKSYKWTAPMQTMQSKLKKLGCLSNNWKTVKKNGKKKNLAMCQQKSILNKFKIKSLDIKNMQYNCKKKISSWLNLPRKD